MKHLMRSILLVCLLLCIPSTSMLPLYARTNHTIEVNESNLQLIAQENMWAISANFDFDLPQKLREALIRGLELSWVLEFELRKPRWYWFDETPIQKQLKYRLYYHALTNQYRLSLGVTETKYSNLADALAALQHIQRWRVFSNSDLEVGINYVAALRLRLDINEFSKPILINFTTNKDWQLQGQWKIFPFKVGQ